jgi:hypothetical protein
MSFVEVAAAVAPSVDAVPLVLGQPNKTDIHIQHKRIYIYIHKVRTNVSILIARQITLFMNQF